MLIYFQFYVSISPITAPGDPPLNAKQRAESFFKSYLAMPVVLVFFICGFLWKGSGFLSISDVDVDTGRRSFDWDKIHKRREEIAKKNAVRRFLNLVF
jgi:amino acid transporter